MQINKRRRVINGEPFLRKIGSNDLLRHNVYIVEVNIDTKKINLELIHGYDTRQDLDILICMYEGFLDNIQNNKDYGKLVNKLAKNGNSIGVFQNEELQIIYDDLIDLGSQSSIDALKVGAAIEELDIRDLLTFMDTDKADILAVYEMLLLGSRNHLRSFDSQLTKNGVDYEAQFLSQSDYDLIANSVSETGFPTSDTVEPVEDIDYTYSIVGSVLIVLGLAAFVMMRKEIN